jgi:hypothetical protein
VWVRGAQGAGQAAVWELAPVHKNLENAFVTREIGHVIAENGRIGGFGRGGERRM